MKEILLKARSIFYVGAQLLAMQERSMLHATPESTTILQMMEKANPQEYGEMLLELQSIHGETLFTLAHMIQLTITFN